MYVLRHGDVVYFADPDAPVSPEKVVLTERGTEQARAAGRALAEVTFDRVICSGLPRTRRTAELVVEQLAQPPAATVIEDWPDLQEFSPGEPADIADEDLEEHFLQAFRAGAAPEAAFLGGETVGSLVARTGAAMDRLWADPSWMTVLAVLHGGVNRAVLSWALAGPGAYFGHIEQAPACINIVDGAPEPVDGAAEFIVRAVNVAPYDLAHAGPRTSTLEEMLAQYRDYRARGAHR